MAKLEIFTKDNAHIFPTFKYSVYFINFITIFIIEFNQVPTFFGNFLNVLTNFKILKLKINFLESPHVMTILENLFIIFSH